MSTPSGTPSKAADVFRERLDAELRSQHLSQNEFAEISGVSQAQISAYRRNDEKRKIPGLEVAEKIAEAFGFPLWQFLQEQTHSLKAAEPSDSAPPLSSLRPSIRALLNAAAALEDSEVIRYARTIRAQAAAAGGALTEGESGGEESQEPDQLGNRKR